jgi:two-component system nitrogen regulation response regulator GlnG
LPARLVARLACHPWPGNVRELRNVARQIAIGGRGRRLAPVDLRLDAGRVIDRGEIEPEIVPERRPPRTITDDELVAVLRSHAFQLSAAAKALGISRTTLDALIDRSARLRKARDISTDEIQHALEDSGGDTRAAAVRLEVSARALELRLREIARG